VFLQPAASDLCCSPQCTHCCGYVLPGWCLLRLLLLLRTAHPMYPLLTLPCFTAWLWVVPLAHPTLSNFPIKVSSVTHPSMAVFLQRAQCLLLLLLWLW
jgi:hypothetical protein